MVDLKKEIKLSDLMPKRKPKPPAEDGAAPEPKEKKEKKDKRPLLKRDLSFKRKPKEPRAEKAEKEPKQKKERKPKDSSSGTKRAKRLVGLKIGASQLAAARVVNNGVPELVQVARTELDPGLVVGGELREPELLADALRTFFRKHGLPRQGERAE